MLKGDLYQCDINNKNKNRKRKMNITKYFTSNSPLGIYCTKFCLKIKSTLQMDTKYMSLLNLVKKKNLCTFHLKFILARHILSNQWSRKGNLELQNFFFPLLTPTVLLDHIKNGTSVQKKRGKKFPYRFNNLLVTLLFLSQRKQKSQYVPLVENRIQMAYSSCISMAGDELCLNTI